MLFRSAGAEVIEIGMPAVHETWVEHNIELPTSQLSSERSFSGQRFVRHLAAQAEWLRDNAGNYEYRDTGIRDATNGLADVRVIRSRSGDSIIAAPGSHPNKITFLFILSGQIELSSIKNGVKTLKAEESFVIPSQAEYLIAVIDNCELLWVAL